MVYWEKFDPRQFEFEFDEDHLAGHGVTVDEAVEVLWNGFEAKRNKGYSQGYRGYQLVGRTDGGRKLKLIVFEKTQGTDSRV